MNRFAIAAASLIVATVSMGGCEKEPYPTLFALCESGDATPERIQAFLDLGVNVNSTDNNELGWTPLHAAAGGRLAPTRKSPTRPSTSPVDVVDRDSEIVTFLIKAGADVNVQSNFGNTPLHFAAGFNNPEVVTLLLEAGADLNAQSLFKSGHTPLHFAAGFNNPEVVTLLLEAGADVKAKDEYGRTTLHFAAESNENPEVVTVLSKAGADVNAKSHTRDKTPLQLAAWRNANPEVLTALIEAGADVNAKADNGGTPLDLAAAANENPEVLMVLIKAGADVNAKSESGLTPLHAAAANNENPEVITILLNAGADVNARDKDGITSLDWAISPPRGKPKPKNAEVLRAAGGKLGKDLP